MPHREGPKRPVWKDILRYLIYVFPGATLPLFLFSRNAFRAHPDDGFSASFSTFSAYVFYWSFYTIMQRAPFTLAALISPLASFCFFALIFVHRETGRMIPVYYLADNLSEVFATAIYSGLLQLVIVGLVVYALFLAAFFLLRRRMSRFRLDYNLDYWPVRAILTVALITVALGWLAPSHMGYFVRSGWNAYRMEKTLQSYDIKASAPLVSALGLPAASDPSFPLLRSLPGNPRAERDVFIVVLESFSGLYPEDTPFLTGLVRESISADQAYSVSINTPRGYLSILCGIYPSFQQKAFVHFADNRYRCLSGILGDAGYATYFFYDIPNLGFDNTYNFLKHIGFEQVHNNLGSESERRPSADAWSSAGDAVFYKDVFRFLREAGHPRPALVAIGTNGNHWPFHEGEESYRTPGLSAARMNELYRKSLRKTDDALRLFFRELTLSPYRDALVVVVGDHPFPAGEHGNFWNENRAYEESFRTVLLIQGAGRKSHPVASQVDIMPTILDALNLRARSHMAGVSLLREPEKRLIQYTQPYDGKFLCSLYWPYKRCHEIERSQTRIFDLSRDPREEKSLNESDLPPEVLEKLRQGQELWLLNQALFLQDAFLPQSR